MTPQDIAIDVSSIRNFGSVEWSTMATYCFGAMGQGQVPDDQRSWD